MDFQSLKNIHTNHMQKNKIKVSYFIPSAWLPRLLCVYKFLRVVLLPRNSNSWQGSLQIEDSGKPADGQTLQFALSFWLRQHLASQACSRQCKKADLYRRESHVADWPNPLPESMRSSWKAIISVGFPLEMPHKTLMESAQGAWNQDETAVRWGHSSAHSSQVCH